MPELIDRQAALKKMCETCGYCERFEKAMRSTHPDFVTDKCNAYKFIADQPTIEAEPVRRGRWKKKNGEIYCTNCKKSKWSESFELMLRGFDFCPKCGADMREGGAGNEHQV